MSKNNATFTKSGSSHIVNAVVSDPKCVINIDGDKVYIDGSEVHSFESPVDEDVLDAVKTLTDISSEHCIITNVSRQRVSLGLPNHNVLMPGTSIDAMLFATMEEINNSAPIQKAKERKLITIRKG